MCIYLFGFIFHVRAAEMQTNIRILAVAVPLIVSSSVVAADRIPYLQTTKSDPFKLCTALEKRLPPKLDGIRKLENLEKETVRPDSDYCSDDLKQCQIHTLTFRGLSIDLLVKVKTQDAGVLDVRVSRSNWDILRPIRVGQKLSVIESHYGVKIPRDDSPIGLIGECSSIDVKHNTGRVTELFLDCQACN